jgi:hypothetical protein
MAAAPPMPATQPAPPPMFGPGPARPDAGRPDAGRPDPGWSDFSRGDFGRTEQIRPDQVRPDQGWADQGRPDLGRPGPGRPDAPAQPTGGWPYVGTPAAPPPAKPAKSRKGLFILVGSIVGVLLLVGAGAIGFLVWSGGNDYPVGSCVRQNGSSAVAVDCSESGAFKVVSKVQSVDLCPDPAQPALVVKELGKSDQVVCLQPAAAS